MNEHIKQAVDYAFDNKISDMQDEINSALLQKVADAIGGKRIEVAQNMMSPAVSESDEDDFDRDEDEDEEDGEDEDKPKKKLKGKQKELDKDEDGDIDEKDFEKLRKEDLDESYIEEKLSVSDGVDAWVSDFVKSDNPKFEGKSKKERIQMALGAYYSAKRAK